MKQAKLQIHFLYFVLLLTIYFLVSNLILFNSYKIQDFSIIKPIDVRNTSIENEIPNDPPSSFNYQLSRHYVRRRLFISDPKKSGKEYVVQIGGLLENKYKLIQVDKEVIIFEFQVKRFTIINCINNVLVHQFSFFYISLFNVL